MPQPAENDVLCGRGAVTNTWSGNKRYRQIVKDNREEYSKTRKKDKGLIARRVVDTVHQSGGRFLRLDKATGEWTDVGHEKAIEKALQSLREKQRESAAATATSPKQQAVAVPATPSSSADTKGGSSGGLEATKAVISQPTRG